MPGQDGAPGQSARDDTPDVESYLALLLPQNKSGAIGAAWMVLDELAGTLTLDLRLAKLEPGREHPLNLYGFTDGRGCATPSTKLDADGDGFVELPEAIASTGGVLLGGGAPVADANGRISLHHTYSFDRADPGAAALFQELQDQLAGRYIGVHGMTAAPHGGSPGGYEADLPVAGGIVLSAPDHLAAGGGLAWLDAVLG